TRVTALVGGIVTRVSAELGSRVGRGDPLGVIFSNELAEAQMKYLSMRAMLEADHQKVERTQQLEAIGAASRQELEEVTAIHTGHETEVAASRQRLQLLGLSQKRVAALQEASQVVSDVVVPSPVQGIVITRTVNPGQVVSAGQDLFVVADLQELEEVTAIHTGHETEVAASRQRLQLLGLSQKRVAALQEASQVVSDVVVPSPVQGIVITRTVNPGQVVSAGQDLFVVADLR